MLRFLITLFKIPTRTLVGFLGILFTFIGGGFLIGFIVHPAMRPEEEPLWGTVGLFLSSLFILFSLTLLVFGMLEHNRRVALSRKTSHPVKWYDQWFAFTGSLGSRQGKSLAVIFLAFFAVFGGLAGGGMLRLGLFMESNKFCGLTCHTEMDPQWITFQESPHSGIQCVKCHIGTTPQQMVLAKMRGTKELFDVLSDNVHKPIGDPVHTLPPVEQSCGKCHKPGNEYEDKVVIREHTLSDTGNTKVYGVVRLKIGNDKPLGLAKGIHWHAAADTNVQFKSEDDKRDRIIYVKNTDSDGKITEYFLDDPLDETSDLSQDNARDLELRKMNCYDCHNRTGHRFDTPEEGIDRALTKGNISRKLPSVRMQGIKALRGRYESDREADKEIKKRITGYYRA
ncbi:MAG: NapC/NirT family cytochrome c, partial [Planctomycetota bacterium]